MEEKKQDNRKFVDANPDSKSMTKKERNEADKKKAKSLRIGAVILWVAAIALEIVAILILLGKIEGLPGNIMYWLIGAIVLDLICAIVGSLLWKKSNRLDPISKQDKFRFFVWNQLGAIVSVLAFLPLLILLLLNKDLDKKTKTIVTIVTAIALLGGTAASIDYNPVSAEDKAEAVETFEGQEVYWATFSKKYHVDDSCRAIVNSDPIYFGTIEDAYENNVTKPCAFCAEELLLQEEAGDEAPAEEDAVDEVDDAA